LKKIIKEQYILFCSIVIDRKSSAYRGPDNLGITRCVVKVWQSASGTQQAIVAGLTHAILNFFTLITHSAQPSEMIA